MNSLLQSDSWLFSPWAWALVAGALAMWLLVPRGGRGRWRRALGGVLGVVSVGLLASRLPVLSPATELVVFWMLAAVTVTSAAAMISMRSPVYCAIWFAMTLLGTAGLFLFQGAQFLAVATIVVYAGAIVVMFLFLIMLAQPQGHEYYDRISWGSPAALFSAIAGAVMVLTLTTAIVSAGSISPNPTDETVGNTASEFGTQTPHHVATLGGVLFSRHLLAVEIGGTLLLIALVGAVAIIMHGRRQESPPTGRQSPEGSA